MIILLLQRVQVGIKEQNTGVIVNLSPLDNTIVPRVLDDRPLNDDILLALEHIVDDEALGVELAFVELVKQEESLGVLVLFDLDGNQTA